MILSKCVVGNNKKFKFLKEQGTRGLISKLTRIKVSIISYLPILNAFFKSIKWMQ